MHANLFYTCNVTYTFTNITLRMQIFLTSFYLHRGRALLPLPQSSVRPGGSQARTTSGSSMGVLSVTVVANPPGNQPSGDHRSSSASQPVELPKVRTGPSSKSVPAVSFGAPPDDRMPITASEGELSGEEDSVALPPSGLEWFLWVARAGSQRPAPVPFFPEVHEELTRSWTAPFTARNRSAGSSSLTTLDGDAAKGYTIIPPVERSVTIQLCPITTSGYTLF